MLSILDPVLDRHPLNRGRTVMSALAALLVVVPLAALQPYRAAAAAPASITPPPVASLPLASAAHGDELPLSFKVTFGDGPQDRATPAPRSAPNTPSTAATAATEATTAAAATLSRAATSLTASSKSGRYECNAAVMGNGQNYLSIHSDNDDVTGVIEYVAVNGTRCAQANVVGQVTYTADETDIADLGEGSHAFFRERSPGDDRELTVNRLNGVLVHDYRRDGRPAVYDDEARRWFAAFLPKMLAESGLNVKPRVARWYREGGTDRALRGIAALAGGSGKRTHFMALLDQPLSRAEVERVVQQGTRAMSGTSDMRAFLTRAAPQLRGSASVATLMSAINAIPGSGDRTAMLRLFGETDDRETLLAIMRGAETVPSSGDKAGLIRHLMPRYLGGDRALRETFFDVVRSIPSSGDMYDVLTSAIPYAAKSDDVALAVIQAAGRMASSGDRASVLVRLARSRPLTSDTLRSSYLGVAREIPSSGDMRRALEALAP